MGDVCESMRKEHEGRDMVIDKVVELTSSRSLSKLFIGWEDMRWNSSLSSLVNVRDSLEVRVDMTCGGVGYAEGNPESGDRPTFGRGYICSRIRRVRTVTVARRHRSNKK